MTKQQANLTFSTVLAFAATYGLCLVVQGLGGYFTAMGTGEWYASLNRSALTPPGIWFGVAWSALYFLMALAAARIVRITGQYNNRPMRWWLIQLFTGLVWCMVFFGHRDIENGLLIIAFEWVAVLLTLRFFWRINKRAGWLIVLLFLWVSFASYLNLFIYLNN